MHDDWHPGPNLPTFVGNNLRRFKGGINGSRKRKELHDKTKVTTFVSWKQRNYDAGHCTGFLTAEPADPPALPAAQRTPRVAPGATTCLLIT